VIVVVESTVSAIADDGVDESTSTPCTIIVAAVEVTVGVTVTDATLFGTVVV
jgi:hypothetical protein